MTTDAAITPRQGRAWTHRPFRWFWTAGALSLLGSEVGDLALPLLALTVLDADAVQLAALRAALFAPFLLWTLAFGVLVDRVRNRPLLLAADLGRGMLLAAVPVLHLLGHLSMWFLVAIVFAVATLTVLFSLAEFTFLPKVVPVDALPDANAKVAATQATVSVAGNGVGGIVVQVLGAPVAIAVNAATYLASAFSLSRVAVLDERPAPRRTSAWREAREGLAFVRRNRIVRALALEATTWNVGNEILLIALTIHVVGTFDAAPVVLGAILVAGGLGSFTGAWFSSRITGRFGYGPALLVALIFGNSAPLAIAAFWGDSLAAAVGIAVVFTISGVGVGLANSQAVTVRQLATPEPMRGRANSAYRLVSWGMAAVGAIVGGVLVAHMGTRPALLVGAAAMAAATVWVAVSPLPRIRTLTEAGTTHR